MGRQEAALRHFDKLSDHKLSDQAKGKRQQEFEQSWLSSTLYLMNVRTAITQIDRDRLLIFAIALPIFFYLVEEIRLTGFRAIALTFQVVSLTVLEDILQVRFQIS